MAEDIGTVYVQVEPSGRGFGKTLEGQVAGAADAGSKQGSTSILSRIGGAFSKIGKIGLGAVTTIGTGIVALAAKGGFERALNIENAQAKLKGLGHDSSSVSEIMNDALASVKGTAFGLGDAATVAASLSASGVKQGSQLTNVLKTVADTAQISGRSLTDIGTIFGSVAARGKLQGDDMLQLMSSGVPVLQLLAKHLNLTSAQVSDMVSAGKIDFQTFADAMQEGMGGAALSAGTTFTGALNNVKAALSRLGEQAATPTLEGLRNIFNDLIPLIDQVTVGLQPLSTMLATRLGFAAQTAGTGIQTLTQALSNGSLSLQDTASRVGQLAGGFGVLIGVGSNITPLFDMFSKLGHAGDKSMSQLTNTVKSLPEGLSNTLGGLQQFRSIFNKDIRDSLTLDGDPLAQAASRVSKGVDGLFQPFKNVGSKLANTGFASRLADFGGNISTGFTKLTSVADSNMKVFSTRLTSGFTSAFGKLGDSKIGSSFTRLTGNVKTAAGSLTSNLGNIFGGFGDMVSTPLQTGLSKVGGLVSSFFAPSNFLKFFGFGALAAALIAGVGLLDQSMGDALPGMISNVAKQAPAFINQFTTHILAALPGVMSSGSQIIISLLNGIKTALPSLFDGAGQIIISLVTGLAQALPGLIPSAVGMITTLVIGLINLLPQIIQAGFTLLQGLVQGLVNALPILLKALPTIITSLVDEFATALPMLFNTGTTILLALINGLVAVMPSLAAMLPTIINTLITFLITNLPTIIQTGVQMLLALINGLVDALPQLIGYLPQIIVSIVSTLLAHLPEIISAAIQIIIALAGGLIQAIPKLISALPEIISSIKDGFTKIDWGEVGKNIINGIRDGIVKFAGNLWDAAKNAAKGALDNVKSFLGIHSPSRVFRDQVGFMIGAGMAMGIKDSGSMVEDSLKAMNLKLTDGINPINATVNSDTSNPVDSTNPGQNGTTVNQYIYPQQDDPRIQMRLWGREASKAMAGAV